MKMMVVAVACLMGMTLQAHADPSKSLDLSANFVDTTVDMTQNSDGILDVLIPAGDNVKVKVVQNDASHGCQSLGISDGGMAWTVELEMKKSTESGSCVFKVIEDNQSVLITLEQ